jgi:polyisoprenoid-binding protein YceI
MTVQYIFDPGESRLTVQAFASGMLRMFAHDPTLSVRNVAGAFNIDPETFANGSLQLSAKANSLEVIDDFSAKDKQEIQTVARDQVLEASRFPEIKYESNDITATKAYGNTYNVEFKGTLTLHGVARPVAVDAQCILLDGSIRLSGTSMVRQPEFNIRPVMIAAKDDVKVSFDIVAKQG